MRGYLAWDDRHIDDGLSVEFEYTRAYREWTGRGLARRELECLRVALPAAAAPIQDGDLLVGRRVFRPLGVAPSYWDDDTDGLDNVSFYADLGRMERVMNRPTQTQERRAAIAGLIDFWKKENVNAKVRAKFDDGMRREMPSDLWNLDSGVIFGLYRLVFSQLDYDKLILKGLPGLRKEVLCRLKDGALSLEQQDFLSSLCGLIDLLLEILGLYAGQLREIVPVGGNALEALELLVGGLERELERHDVDAYALDPVELADLVLDLRGAVSADLSAELVRFAHAVSLIYEHMLIC